MWTALIFHLDFHRLMSSSWLQSYRIPNHLAPRLCCPSHGYWMLYHGCYLPLNLSFEVHRGNSHSPKWFVFRNDCVTLWLRQTVYLGRPALLKIPYLLVGVFAAQSPSPVWLFTSPWTVALRLLCPSVSPRVYSESCPHLLRTENVASYCAKYKMACY